MTATKSLLLVFALLIATPLASAGKLKGAKGPSKTPTTRALKDKQDKGAKTKKVAGPGARSCTSKASKKEVTFECSSGGKGAVKAAAKAGDDKEAKQKGGDVAELEDAAVQAPEPGTRALGVEITPNENIKDKIKYKVKTAKEGIQVEIEYEHEDQTGQTDTEFELFFDKVVEYKKGKDSSNEAYDWESDSIVQTIDLTGWQDMSDISTDETEIVSFFTATSALAGESDTRSPGSIEFNYTISTEDKSEIITANSMKIDVRILNFPWKRDDTYIALMSTVESKKNVKLSHDETATVGNVREAEDVLISFTETVAEKGISAFGEYTWALEALATPDKKPSQEEGKVVASTIEVIATSPADEETDNLQHIAYSFVGENAHLATEIYWDPQAGIGYEEPVSDGSESEETKDSESETSANEASSAASPSIGLISSLIAAMLYLVV